VDFFKDLVLALPMSDMVFDRLMSTTSHPVLCTGHALTDHQWRTLWRAKLPVNSAVSLVSRPLSSEQVDLVLACEKRSTVMSAMFKFTEMSLQQQRTALSVVAGSGFAATVMTTPLDPEILALAAGRLDGVHRLDWCVNNPSVSDDDTLEAIFAADQAAKQSLWQRSRLIVKAIHSRPGLVDALFELDTIPDSAITALAGSRLIASPDRQERFVATGNEFATLAFVANPVVSLELVAKVDATSYKVADAVRRRKQSEVATVTEPYDTVSDPAQLNWLLRRAMPSSFKPAGRPWDLVVLGRNQHIVDDAARRIYDILEGSGDLVDAASINHTRAHLAGRLSLVETEPVCDLGFWSTTNTWFAERYEQPRWVLDPDARPWSSDTVAEALAGQDAAFIERIRATKLMSLRYIDPTVVHLVLVAELGDHPARFETAVNLSASHQGDLASLLSAARKLSR
jgi:hypothetical protein